MKIIDFRFRPNTPEAISGMLANPVFGDMYELFNYKERAHSQPLDTIVEELRELGVVKGVVTSRDAETTYGIKSGDQGVIDLVKAVPDLFIGYAGFDPHKGAAGIEIVEKRIREDGLKGVCTDPYLARLPASHDAYRLLYEKCCELGIPVVITTGPATRVAGAVMEDAHPRYIDRVATDFPNLKIIISHGCYPWVNEVIMVVHRHKHVYMEMSEYELAPFAEGYMKAANELIGDKIVFASASPFLDIKKQVQIYKELPLHLDVLEMIMYTNAAKLLGLSA